VILALRQYRLRSISESFVFTIHFRETSLNEMVSLKRSCFHKSRIYQPVPNRRSTMSRTTNPKNFFASSREHVSSFLSLRDNVTIKSDGRLAGFNDIEDNLQFCAAIVRNVISIRKRRGKKTRWTMGGEDGDSEGTTRVKERGSSTSSSQIVLVFSLSLRSRRRGQCGERHFVFPSISSLNQSPPWG